MAKVSWDDELAYLADLNTKQCAMVRNFYKYLKMIADCFYFKIHDPCRNTRKFEKSLFFSSF